MQWHPRNMYIWSEDQIRQWYKSNPKGYSYFCGHMWQPVVLGTNPKGVSKVIFEIYK
jgi:hypothetical protein